MQGVGLDSADTLEETMLRSRRIKKDIRLALALCAGFAVLLIGSVGCGRIIPLTDLDVEDDRRQDALNNLQVETHVPFKLYPWPEGLPKRAIRVLAGPKFFDRFVGFLPDNEDHIEACERGFYSKDEAGEYKRAYPKTDEERQILYVRLKPRSILDFEKQYGVVIEIDEMQGHLSFEKPVALVGNTARDESNSEPVLLDADSSAPNKTEDLLPVGDSSVPPGKPSHGSGSEAHPEISNAFDYDIVLSPRYEISPLLEEEPSSLLPFSELGFARLEEILESSERLFAVNPEDPDYRYSIPLFWRTFGLFYDMGRVPKPPRNLKDFFEVELIEANWGRISFVDNMEITVGMAIYYLMLLSPEEYKFETESTKQFLAGFEAIQARSDKVERDDLRLRVGRLLRQYSELEKLRDSKNSQFGVHRLSFSHEVDSLMATAAHPTNSIAKHVDGIIESVGGKEKEAERDRMAVMIKDAFNLIKKCVIYGGHFRPGETFDTGGNEENLITFGAGDEGVFAMAKNRGIRFVMPDSGTFVVLEVLVVPNRLGDLDLENDEAIARSGFTPRQIELELERRRRTKFFLGFLLQAGVMADLTAFNLRANTSLTARSFLSPELLHSSIYTLPPIDRMLYIPIRNEVVHHSLQDQWDALKEFERSIPKFDFRRVPRTQ